MSYGTAVVDGNAHMVTTDIILASICRAKMKKLIGQISTAVGNVKTVPERYY